MPSNVYELCGDAKTKLAVPPFPIESIRDRLERAPADQPRQRRISAFVAASLAFIAVGAAAAVLAQSHIAFTRSGGMVLHSQQSSNRAISSDADLERAAAQMDFHVTLPRGLPAGSRPIRLYIGDNDIMAITYDLPGSWRASHHLAWIFLANPGTMSGKVPRARYALRTDHHMSSSAWQTAGEQVIVVSNGLTPNEVAKIKFVMGGQ